jgi:hypothetical protein
MKRTVTTLAAGVAIAAGTAGCGLSSSHPSAVAVPLPSAAHVLARSERALARMHSFQVFMRIVVAHQPTTDMTDEVRDGGYQVSFHGNNLAVQTRVIGHSVYSNFHAVGNLGNTLAELGRSTGVGRWYRVPAPPEIVTLERESRPANLAGCMLGTRIGRPSLVAQTTTFNGLAADVVDVHQGAAGTLRVMISADPTYLPLQVTRTGVHGGPGLWRWVDRYSRAGCGLDTHQLRALAAQDHGHLVATKRATTTFQRYDAPDAVPVPRRAPAVPLSSGEQRSFTAV